MCGQIVHESVTVRPSYELCTRFLLNCVLLLFVICGYHPCPSSLLNSSRPRQNSRLFADDTFKRIFLNENIRISTKNSLKFVPRGLISNIPALVLIMAWRRPGDKSLSKPMLVRSLTHICVTRPQWDKLYLENRTIPLRKWSSFEKIWANYHRSPYEMIL